MNRPLHLKRWTVPIARRLTLARLQKIDALLIDIAGVWGDVDQCLVDLADDLRVEVSAFCKELDESIAERAEREAAGLL